MDNTDRVAMDILYRLQVCFPGYKLSYSLDLMTHMVFAEFRLSMDGRHEWTELIPDRDGNEHPVRFQIFHLRTPMSPPELSDPNALRYFGRFIVERFVQSWFAERMKRAGIEP